MDEQLEFEQKSKHLLNVVKKSDNFNVKEIYGGEVVLALDKHTGYIFRFSVFKDKFEFDFISDKEAKAISELISKDKHPKGEYENPSSSKFVGWVVGFDAWEPSIEVTPSSPF